MEVAINNHVYQQAQDYAQSQGVSLSAVIVNLSAMMQCVCLRWHTTSSYGSMCLQ